MNSTATRCGQVAVVGRANTGKSTLVNALLGRQLHIATHKPQTTRQPTASALTLNEDQLVLVDTPGLHRHKKQLNRQMNRSALAQMEGAEVVLAVFDRTICRQDDHYLVSRCRDYNCCLAVLNKVDLLADKARLLPRIEALADTGCFAHIVPVSARRGDNLDRLQQLLLEQMPLAPHRMEADCPADRPDSFFAAETIREQLLLRYREEIPHSLKIELEEFVLGADRVQIRAVLKVRRAGQKKIVEGAGNHQLRALRQSTQEALERRFSVPAEVNLRVAVGGSGGSDLL